MNEKIKYKTTVNRIDIETGEILENIDISEYVKIGKEEKYKKISEKEIEKKLIIKYKHNGQTAIKFGN